MISPELRTILTDWLDWATGPSPEDTPRFRRAWGLCTTVASYAMFLDMASFRELDTELSNLLRRDFGDSWAYPFGGFLLFWQEHDDRTAYLNPQRLAWVKEKLDVEKA